MKVEERCKVKVVPPPMKMDSESGMVRKGILILIQGRRRLRDTVSTFDA